MGIPILLSSEDRVATKHTSFMIHGVSGGDYGKINNRKQNLEHGERLQEFCKEVIVENTKFTNEQIDDIFEKCKEEYFYTDRALEVGVISEII